MTKLGEILGESSFPTQINYIQSTGYYSEVIVDNFQGNGLQEIS